MRLNYLYGTHSSDVLALLLKFATHGVGGNIRHRRTVISNIDELEEPFEMRNNLHFKFVHIPQFLESILIVLFSNSPVEKLSSGPLSGDKS